MSKEKNLNGLSGWLILVGIGLIITPIRLVLGYGPLFYSIFTDGTFEYLTDATSQAYHPLWGAFLIGEVLYNSLMVLAYSYLIYLFFTKHYLFPKIYILLIAISLIVIPFDAWVGSLIIKDEPMFDPETAKEFMRSLFAGLIWVPYMLLSKRVKATFIEKKPQQPDLEPTLDTI